MVQAEYPQDWLTERLEETGHKQAAWRTSTRHRPGAGGASAISARTPIISRASSPASTRETVRADLDDLRARAASWTTTCMHALLRWPRARQARVLWASQVAPGNENGLGSSSVYGTQGRAGMAAGTTRTTLHWFAPFGEPTRVIARATGAGRGRRQGG